MSDTRRILTLRDLGQAFPDAADRAAQERATAARVAATEARAAARSGKVITHVKRPVAANMNSARPVEIPDSRVVSLSQSLARKATTQGVSSRDFEVRPHQDFRAAVADVNYPSINPSCLPIPTALLAQLTDPNVKSIVLIGHQNADHDALGATLTLARALRLLDPTKKIEVCIDDEELGLTMSRFVAPGEVKTAKALAGRKFDLAVVCDAARSSALGGAVDFVKSAKARALIDHHRTDHKDDLEYRYGIKALWHDDETDAASLQVCAIAERLLAGKQLDPSALKHVFAPALAGMCTDTAWGTRSNAMTPHIFKHVIKRAGMSVADLERMLHFAPPAALTAAIAGMQGIIKREALGENRRMMVVSVNRNGWNTMLAVARKATPTFAGRDLMQVLKGEIGSYRNAHGCVALVVQVDASAIISARSTDGRARELCHALRGGGQDNASSATIYGAASFDDALKELSRVARQNRIIS